MKNKLIILIFSLFINVNNVYAQTNDTLIIDGNYEKYDASKLSANIKHLSIINIDLTSIPNEVYKLKNLETLDFSNNNLKYISDNLNSLTKLKVLSIRNNRLTNFDNITKLNNLSILDLSGNNLTKISSIKNFSKLNELNLSLNILNSVVDLNKLSKLKSVDLSTNQLIYLSKLPNNLSYLNIDDNYLTSVTQYNNYVKNQNKIIIKSDITKKQIIKAGYDKKYVKYLISSNNDKAVVGFTNYKLLFNVNNKSYTLDQLFKTFQDNVKYTITIDVVNHDNNKVRLNDPKVYNYSYPDYQQTLTSIQQAQVIEDNEAALEKDKAVLTNDFNSQIISDNDYNYFDNSLFKTLSVIIAFVLLIPIVVILIVFIYMNIMNKRLDRVVIGTDYKKIS